MLLGSPAWCRLIVDGAAAFGLTVKPEHARLFARHAALLLKWNRVTNLTAITDPAAMALNHYLDCLAAAPLLRPGDSLLDAGSGAGFPGIPLHITVPGLKTTLIDASRKKVSFLRQVIRDLELDGIHALQARVEAPPAALAADGGFRVIASRAFSALEVFLRAASPLLGEAGCIVAFKGQLAVAHAEALGAAAGRGEFGVPLALDVRRYAIPGLRAERSLVLARRLSG
jgi:16S rRNA (guanine527-N7)-methyltransferase